MKTVKVKFPSNDVTNKVKEFCNLASANPFDIDLVSGRYIVDAKSIMGIFSLDLSKEINLDIHSNDNAATEKFIKSIEEYVVK